MDENKIAQFVNEQKELRALDQIDELIRVTVAIVKKANTGSGRIPKTLLKRERKAIDALMLVLAGRKVTDAEYDELSQ